MRLTTMMTFCMISLGIFAQKAPKGKLISYSHISDNPELPLHSEFSLDRNDGKGTLKIYEWLLLNEDDYTGEAGEDVFSRAADIIKEKKLYAIKKRKKASTSDPEQGSYSIVFEDKTINFEAKDLSEEQHSNLSYLENFIKDAVKRIEPPTGRLVGCSWAHTPVLPGAKAEYEYLSVRQGLAPELVIGENSSTPGGHQEKRYLVTEDDVKELQRLILDEEVYKMDGYQGRGPSGSECPESRISLTYDNGAVYQARWTHQYPTSEVKKAVGTVLGFFTALTKKYEPTPPFPEGRMIYCSCAYTNHGLPAGNIRHSYYELIADKGAAPKVVYCEERDGDPQKTEYRATEQDVNELTTILREKDVFGLNGYNVDEQMTGGTSYRIYMEFSTGEKLNATWYAEKPLPLATETYGTILRHLKTITER